MAAVVEVVEVALEEIIRGAAGHVGLSASWCRVKLEAIKKGLKQSIKYTIPVSKGGGDASTITKMSHF